MTHSAPALAVDNAPSPKCSFCGCGKDQAMVMVAGPAAVFICDQCVAICVDVVFRQNRNAHGLPFLGQVR